MTAEELVAKSRNLPQISAAALKVVELLEADDDSDEAIRLIKSDSVLLAKLLRVCNSSAAGLPPSGRTAGSGFGEAKSPYRFNCEHFSMAFRAVTRHNRSIP